MAKESCSVFKPEDLADEASNAFERYDLVTAPVVDEKNKLVGRLTVEAVMDFIRQESENEKFSMAGLTRRRRYFFFNMEISSKPMGMVGNKLINGVYCIKGNWYF